MTYISQLVKKRNFRLKTSDHESAYMLQLGHHTIFLVDHDAFREVGIFIAPKNANSKVSLAIYQRCSNADSSYDFPDANEFDIAEMHFTDAHALHYALEFVKYLECVNFKRVYEFAQSVDFN